MMCRVCGGRFEPQELRTAYEAVPYGEGVCDCPAEAVCPDCGAAAVCEEYGCAQCGEEIPSAELNDGLCRLCVEDLHETLDWMWEMLSPVQKRWATEHTDWMDD